MIISTIFIEHNGIVINPFPAFKSRSSTNRTVMVEIPSGQTSTATSPDESAQILMATTEPLTELPESIDLTGIEDQVSKEDALNICNIRYALAATSYTRYIETPIVENISDELQAAVLESQAQKAIASFHETRTTGWRRWLPM